MVSLVLRSLASTTSNIQFSTKLTNQWVATEWNTNQTIFVIDSFSREEFMSADNKMFGEYC